jgi:UDP-glucose 4-epimerase
VREVIASCGRVVGRPVPFVDAPPRPGDPAVSLADPSKMARELGYRAERSLDDMVASAWRWLEQNPDGYPK